MASAVTVVSFLGIEPSSAGRAVELAAALGLRSCSMQLDARELARVLRLADGSGGAAHDLAPSAAAVAVDGTLPRARLWLSRRPICGSFQGEAERVVAVMPAQQGVVALAGRSRRSSRSARKMRCPFPMRCSTGSWSSTASKAPMRCVRCMRQLWRVLAPEGRILIVAPNRTSLWAQLERSPFANGTAVPSRRARPAAARVDVRTAAMGSRAVRTAAPRPAADRQRHGMGTARAAGCGPRLGGVHLVEATKSLYAPVADRRPRRSPNPSSRARDVCRVAHNTHAHREFAVRTTREISRICVRGSEQSAIEASRSADRSKPFPCRFVAPTSSTPARRPAIELPEEYMRFTKSTATRADALRRRHRHSARSPDDTTGSSMASCFASAKQVSAALGTAASQNVSAARSRKSSSACSSATPASTDQGVVHYAKALELLRDRS